MIEHLERCPSCGTIFKGVSLMFRLGPSLNSVEPDPSAPAAPGAGVSSGFQEVEFVSPGYEAGGKVHFKLSAKSADTDVRPVGVHVFVLPLAEEPSGEARTPEFFMTSAYPRHDFVVPDDGTETMASVDVAGVKPGNIVVQVVNEYPG